MPEHPGGLPVGFVPMFRDDSAPHQIRILRSGNVTAVSCTCRAYGVNDTFTKTAFEPLAAPIADAGEALNAYRNHLKMENVS